MATVTHDLAHELASQDSRASRTDFMTSLGSKGSNSDRPTRGANTPECSRFA